MGKVHGSLARAGKVIQHTCLVSEMRTTVTMLEDLLEEETKLQIIDTMNVHLLDSV